MAASKKPVSDVASRRYKTSSYRLDSSDKSGAKDVTRYDRLTGGTSRQMHIPNPRRNGRPVEGARNTWTAPTTTYKDTKTATNVKQRTRKSVTPKRRSK